jgi:hypothetical protein
MDEALIESMLVDCNEALDEYPERFNKWESDFIESVSEQNETGHLTTTQVEKLEQIWEDHA